MTAVCSARGDHNSPPTHVERHHMMIKLRLWLLLRETHRATRSAVLVLCDADRIVTGPAPLVTGWAPGWTR